MDGVDEPEASGAIVGCECGWCRELRLRDDDRISYTAREMARAWIEGWIDGRRSAMSDPLRVEHPVPSVGRIVHYVSAGDKSGKYPSVCRAAVVTELDPDDERRVSLLVCNPTGIHFVERVKRSDTKEPMTWHWPERV